MGISYLFYFFDFTANFKNQENNFRFVGKVTGEKNE